MSWQTYVDHHLMCEIDGVSLTAAAIIGHDGSIWAQSATFPRFKPEEIAKILKDFDEPGFLAPTGLYLGGTITKHMDQGEPGALVRGYKTHRRHENTHLRVDKEMLRAENMRYREALSNTYCSRCRRLISASELSFDQHQKGSGGVTIKKTCKALIFGVYEEPMTAGQCSMVVEKLGDYLIAQGM